ncbi:hypothetical protein CEUSTIGMA_g12314.t1 [Chlamydomonas eustigma]|uniref:N-acetyltransferase domain-containing protein n=1 Tax=Chlamydomonas eustigma TaxID=1157962 RepID=A0A250XPG7_9CHLO|nr:hypothetical protein CEUSTIGMA_g12314.t1 [Chlamydomonas eustigma]|eukprot:GAX84893.1 hypothetical protein CEUSTIGMA_g12314.t1 [Chlamydomonas eustigma]
MCGNSFSTFGCYDNNGRKDLAITYLHKTSANVTCRQVTASDLPTVKRLHKFAKVDNKPVFGTKLSGIEEMLQHAVTGMNDVIGFVACSEGDASDVLGCVTIQREGPISPISVLPEYAAIEHVGISPQSSGKAIKAGNATSVEAPASDFVGAENHDIGNNDESLILNSSRHEFCLLTLVVRADQRRQGIGKILVETLNSYAVQTCLIGGSSTSHGSALLVTDVAAGNPTALKFFEACGFQKKSERSDKTVELFKVLC